MQIKGSYRAQTGQREGRMMTRDDSDAILVACRVMLCWEQTDLGAFEGRLNRTEQKPQLLGVNAGVSPASSDNLVRVTELSGIAVQIVFGNVRVCVAVKSVTNLSIAQRQKREGEIVGAGLGRK
ncbi:hypothetical protein TWF225_006079 [Orbilia oligospora]|nr:hypothetical protein TWF751_000812 [Orbilia oligospora]KAF3184412.1 hypothetical protein TWF225_006079 [Orbilia oligospora]KAF3238416.1 hypothetical protein TWF128_012061 [Orbilia oligospora]KAF3241541.1 hypothetical protein TWF217_012003 [Orbilia oligospora]